MTPLRAHPAISIPPVDYDRLLAMAEGTAKRHPNAASFLMQELDRASVKTPEAGRDIVRMQSHVRFRDDATGRVRDIQLVYPDQADPVTDRISVLTPVGTALIGLSKGQSMPWTDPNGKRKSVTVLSIQNALP